MNKKANGRKIAFSLILLLAGMSMLTAASVPLYNLFCKVTGYGGTIQYAPAASTRIGSKMLKIRFDANVDSNLPWEFKSEQQEVEIRVGENNLIFYSAMNKAEKPVIGTAVYNVTPHIAGKYFNKIQCFCFTDQMLMPKQKIMMPVSFFIDADIENDKNLKDIDTITLSYTFYPVNEENK